MKTNNDYGGTTWEGLGGWVHWKRKPQISQLSQSTSWLNMVTRTHYQTLQKICLVDPSPGYRMVNKHHCFINSRHFGSLICSHRSSLRLSVHFSWLKKNQFPGHKTLIAKTERCWGKQDELGNLFQASHMHWSLPYRNEKKAESWPSAVNSQWRRKLRS